MLQKLITRYIGIYNILYLKRIYRTCRPWHSSVLDQRSHSELFERTVSGHQTVTHGSNHVNVAGPEPVHAGRPHGAPAESRRRHVLARERHRSWKRWLSPNTRWPGCHDDVFAHGRRLQRSMGIINQRANTTFKSSGWRACDSESIKAFEVCFIV